MTIVWDMDGTIADTYAVHNWVEKLNAGMISPYLDAAPLWDMARLRDAIIHAKEYGHKMIIVSWSCKNDTSASHSRAVKNAKLEWLKRMGIYDCFDSIHVVKYGTPKHKVVREGIIIDDNKDVRAAWEAHIGKTVNPCQEDVIEFLMRL